MTSVQHHNLNLLLDEIYSHAGAYEWTEAKKAKAKVIILVQEMLNDASKTDNQKALWTHGPPNV